MSGTWDPELLEIPGVTGIPVTVQGGPRDTESCSAYGPTAWGGCVVAPEPVLALVFGTEASGVRWMKSVPSWGNAVRVDVAHGPNGPVHDAHVTLGPLVWPPSRAARTWDEVGARARGIRPADGEIQVPGTTATAHLSVRGRAVDTPEVRPLPRIEGETGRVLPLLHLPGASPISFDLFVLPRRVVRVGRCKIWRLKPRYGVRVPEPLRHVLVFGRAGRWPPVRWPQQRYGTGSCASA